MVMGNEQTVIWMAPMAEIRNVWRRIGSLRFMKLSSREALLGKAIDDIYVCYPILGANVG